MFTTLTEHLIQAVQLCIILKYTSAGLSTAPEGLVHCHRTLYKQN